MMNFTKRAGKQTRYAEKASLILLALAVNLSLSAQNTDILQQNEDLSNSQPKAALKTNMLYNATGTLNLAAEFLLAPQWTIEVTIAHNPFIFEKGGVNRVAFVQPEVRYWFCRGFERHFIGSYGIYGSFNIGEVGFLTKTFEEHRYKGRGAGAGLSYGYHLPLGGRWATEFTLGVGYLYLEYDKFRCYECDEFVARKNRHYFGPAKAGVSFIYCIQ